MSIKGYNFLKIVSNGVWMALIVGICLVSRGWAEHCNNGSTPTSTTPTSPGHKVPTQRPEDTSKPDAPVPYDGIASGVRSGQLQAGKRIKLGLTDYVVGPNAAGNMTIYEVSAAPTIQDFIKTWKGTGSLHLAAFFLHMYYGPEFRWTNDTNIVGVSSLTQFLDFRAMSCFEFVCFTAWIAGDQKFTHGGKLPWIGMSKSTVLNPVGLTVWNGKTVIPAGKVIAGWAKWPVGEWTHTRGNYHHVGISLGSGYMISLRGDGNLVVEKVADYFGAGYSEVQFGDFNWKVQTGSIPTAR